MKSRVFQTLAITLGLLVMGYTAVAAQPVKQPFEWIVAKRLTVNTTTLLTGDVVAGDDLTVADDLATSDLFATAQTTQTITAGGTITPTGMYHKITAAAARGTSSVAGRTTAGRIVTIINVGSNTITLTDTGTLKLSGNAALSQYDNITLMSDGTNWIEISETNN